MKLRDPTPFCLFPGKGCGVPTAPRVASADEVEQEFWDAIKNSRDARDHRDYLQRYPNGRFGVLAQRQLRLLEDGAARGPLAGGAAMVPLPMPATTAPRPPAMEKVTATAEVRMNAGLATLNPGGQAQLDELVAQARAVTLEVIMVTGHASPDEGNAEATRQLGQRRAEAVKAYLVARGIERNRIYTQGMGANLPKGDNTTAEGRINNRRVELELVGIRAKP